jgi:hypothetical protein
MRNRRPGMALRVFVFFALGLTMLAGEAAACECRGGITPCQEYFEASVVFLGVVTGSSKVTLDQGDYAFPQRLFQFRLEQAYRGIAGKEVQVITGMGGGDCGYGFRLGEKYLVYAFRNKDNKLSTSSCTRTRPFSEAQEDLDYIRGISTAPRGSIIFGEVIRVNRNSSDGRATPVEGARISIVGPSKRVEVLTDSKGQYKASELPPGAYKVKLNLPEGLSIYDPEREANVSDRGCAQVGFWVEADTRITGKVSDLQGQPISNVLLELVPVKPAPNGSFPQFVRTDSEGRYEMKLVPPGRYLLGVRIYGSAGSTYVPYRRTYYPGVFDESQATVINIAEGQVVNAVDLNLPPPLIERKLEGVVGWPDEQPVKGATVWLKEIEYPNGDMPYRATTDDQGRFSFKVFEGMKYSLVAIVDSEIKGKQKRSETLEIRATENPEVLKLIVNRADGP